MASEDRAVTESSPADGALGRVFERLPTAIAVFDPQGELTLADPVLERLLALNRVDWVGRRLAGRASAALAVADGRAGAIDLLFIDIVIPGTSGTELANRFSERSPGTRVVNTTGYTDDETLRRHPIDPRYLVEKPFLPSDLLRTVSAALDATVAARDPAAG